MIFIFGSVFLFVDEKGLPVVHPALLFLITTICVHYIWVVTEQRLNAQETRRGIDPDSVIGLIGTTTTFVEDVGLVKIEGEIWPACSDQPIPSGSTVRVIKYLGRVLVVKKVEKLDGK
jgi:membrane-bound ClpP family serine protease